MVLCKFVVNFHKRRCFEGLSSAIRAHVGILSQFLEEGFFDLVAVLTFNLLAFLVEPAETLVRFLLFFNFDNLVEKVHCVRICILLPPFRLKLYQFVKRKHLVA